MIHHTAVTQRNSFMKITKMLLAALMLMGVVAVTSLQAQPLSAAPENEKGAVILKPLEKLGRGISNVAFGIFEVPMQMKYVNNRAGGIAGLTYGTLRGVAFFVARVGVGLLEIVTFPFPLPDCPETPEGFGPGYGPIMYPAWVIDVEHDWWNFVYDRDSIPAPTY